MMNPTGLYFNYIVFLKFLMEFFRVVKFFYVVLYFSVLIFYGIVKLISEPKEKGRR